MIWLALAAHAGELDAQLSVDGLTATSVDEAPGAGDPDALNATELGMRLRAELYEDDERLHAAVDYRGREPVAGTFQNETVRLLYTGEIGYQLVQDRVDLTAGRFVAPTIVLLPVDGARLEVGNARTEVGLFAGRRAFTTSRINLPLGDILPAAGLTFRHTDQRVQLDGTAAWATDRLAFSGAHTEDVSGPLAHARGTFVLADPVAVGGQLSFASQATYVIGPTWTEHEVELTALDLWNGLLFGDWRPADRVRLDYTLQAQSVGVYGTGTTNDLLEVQDPRFLDNRLRGSFAPLGVERGWLRADVRHRIRHDRTELRYGATVEANDIGMEGPYARASTSIDDLMDPEDPVVAPLVDRLYWTASAGWRKDALDAELGASFTERAAAPVSGRQASPADPGLPATSDDLSPFVLEAQEIWFVRGFYSGRQWFGGLDLEGNVRDSEFRALLQVGLLTRKEW